MLAAKPSAVVSVRLLLVPPRWGSCCGSAVGTVAAMMRSSLNGEAFSRPSAEPCVWAAKSAICCRSVSLEGSKSSLASVFSVQNGIFLRSLDRMRVSLSSWAIVGRESYYCCGPCVPGRCVQPWRLLPDSGPYSTNAGSISTWQRKRASPTLWERRMAEVRGDRRECGRPPYWLSGWPCRGRALLLQQGVWWSERKEWVKSRSRDVSRPSPRGASNWTLKMYRAQ